jgi:hypothetical protein
MTRSALLLAALGAAATTCIAPRASAQGVGPDVIVGELPDVSTYTAGGAVNGRRAWAVGTTSCNLGTQELTWNANTNVHPVISQNLYRLANGRFEQIGQAWLKHGFCALQGTVCSTGCQPSPLGCGALGVQCSDPYSSGLNGTQSGLGPKSEVNAATGAFPYPWQNNGTGSGALFKRLQANETDLTVAGAQFFVSSMYVQPQDAAAHNNTNNQSYRPVTFTAGTFAMNLTGSTHRQSPGIQAWRDSDAGVTISNVDVSGDGRFIIASKATALGGGVYHYEYAVENLTSDRSGQSFSIPVPAGTTVTNVGFHDVDYHSGEPWSGTDWTPVVGGSSVSWATQTFAQNANANALRWDTIYNFRFDANVAPGTGSATIGLFKSGSPASVSGGAVVPGGGPPPPPGNDACANAAALGNGQTSVDTPSATTDPQTQTGCGTNTSFFNDVWYTYSSPCAGSVTITTCGATFDTKLAVYPTCPAANNTAIICNDDSNACGTGSLQSSVTFAATAGTTYKVRVGSFTNGVTGSGNLTVTGPSCGPSDTCANAAPIAYGATPFSNAGATNDGPAPTTCGTGNQIGADIWFTYTACASGSHTLDTCTGGNYDSVLVIYTGACGALTSVACNDDANCGGGGLSSRVTWTATAGTTYRIRVGGYQGATGSGTLTLTGPSCGAPPNNACANATPIAAYGATSFSNAGATNDGPAPTTCGTGNQIGADVWFSYTACVGGSHTVNTCSGGSYDSVLVVYTGACGALTEVGCNDDTAGCGANALSSSVTWNATAGTTYRIRVGGYQGATGSGTLTLTGPTCPPPGPANDNCNNRAGVSLGATPFSTVGATTDGPAHATCANAGSNQITNDIWYNYPSQCSGTLTVDTCTGTNYDSKIAIYAYDGTCATINDATIRACNDDACGAGGLASRLSIPVVAGQNYAIRVGGFNGATGTGTLTLSCVSCRVDINGDNQVNVADFLAFLQLYSAGSAQADMNSDGQVNVTDYLAFLQLYSAGC